jgi:hypothetical protein
MNRFAYEPPDFMVPTLRVGTQSRALHVPNRQAVQTAFLRRMGFLNPSACFSEAVQSVRTFGAAIFVRHLRT